MNRDKMNLFFSPEIQTPTHLFDRDESGHITRVLRLKKGDQVQLTDGHGSLFDCEIESAEPHRCTVRVLSCIHVPRSFPALHIAIAPTRNIGRFEWFIEKAAEIGTETITPLICSRSERKGIRSHRLENILVAAMKQSLSCWLPQLNEPQLIGTFLKQSFPGQKLIASCEIGGAIPLQKVIIPGKPAVILIGPEGDFSPEETDKAMESGFIPVGLGPGRLRTETAGLVAGIIFHMVNT